MEMVANHQLASLILLMGLFTSATAITVIIRPSRRDLFDAIKEMQEAKYYSFVMLIKMHPLQTLLQNVTFFMPSDKNLSDSSLSEDGVHQFLLEHSIPTPLLFDQLRIFPTASMIPTSHAGFMLNVSNNGVKSFYINNVQIVGPNICTSGSSISIATMYLLTNIQLALLVLLMSLITSPSSSATNTTTNNNLYNAIKDMQNASYFSFVMLINMYPVEKFPKNVTFFMPSDRTLSQTSLSESMLHFLLRHSIPSPLHFDHLALLPTGSVIPTSQPGYNLRVSNYGKKGFYLNRIQITTPNICTSETSIRCHGISGVLGSVRNRSHAVAMPRQSSVAPMLLPLKNVVPMPAPAPFGALKSDGPSLQTNDMRLLKRGGKSSQGNE
ncbi:hypothetical protein Sjap_004131 [Stephania japonica]|uniref:FAS1 domain-containing protein n=1 Tax=Stephania japonica TaxID=461633 RepID=A0AAP0K393_9MAGN